MWSTFVAVALMSVSVMSSESNSEINLIQMHWHFKSSWGRHSTTTSCWNWASVSCLWRRVAQAEIPHLHLIRNRRVNTDSNGVAPVVFLRFEILFLFQRLQVELIAAFYRAKSPGITVLSHTCCDYGWQPTELITQLGPVGALPDGIHAEGSEVSLGG